MYYSTFNHNLIILFCILLMINGCNNQKTKFIIETNNIPEKTKEKVETVETNKPFVIKKGKRIFF